MGEEEQSKITSEVKNDATVQEATPSKPTALSDADLDNVAGGVVRTGDIFIGNNTNTVGTANWSSTNYTIKR